MRVIGVIPGAISVLAAFQGKPLADILGKPMMQHVWERRATRQNAWTRFVVATDDERITDAVAEFGGQG